MGWKQKSGIIAAVLVLLYTLAGFVVIPLTAESILPDKLSEKLNRPASVKDIAFNPYALAFSLEGLEIRQKSGQQTFVSWDRLFVNLQWASIFQLSPVVKELRLENPLVRIARVSETEMSFSDLLAGGAEEEPPAAAEEKEKEPFRFSIANIAVSGGRFVFRDAPMDKTHRFTGISFTLPLISNFTDNIESYAKPVLQGSFNNTRIKVDAAAKPFAESLQTELDISLQGLQLPYYFAYVPARLGFSVTGGSLDLNPRIRLQKGENGRFRLRVSGTAGITGLVLEDKASTEIVSVPQIQAEMAPSEPLEGNIRIAELSLTEPSVTLVRRADGGLNLAELGPPPAPEEDEDAVTPAEKSAESESPSFLLELGEFSLDSGEIRFRDYAAPGVSDSPVAGPVTMRLEKLDLSVSDFSTKSGSRAKMEFSAALPPKTSLSVSGGFGVSPLAADLAIDVRDADVTRIQPYFPKPLNLVLTGGRLHMAADAQMKKGGGKGISARVRGDAGISDFSLAEESTGRDFLKWSAFDLKGLQASWNPARFELEELSLAGMEQQVVVDKEGRLNLGQIYEKPSAGQKPAEKSREGGAKGKEKGDAAEDGGGAPFPISIGQVTLSNLAVSFRDYQIDPHYATRLTLAEGSIQGLSTENFEGAKLRLKGAVDEHAPLSVSGRINPLLRDLFLDARFDLQNLELSPFSTYSGKYIGRAIEKGKLNLNLNYLVKNDTLKAENKLLLDQFTLGRKVRSEQALNLPVGLAVALLKNRQGEIDLDLPVSGRLDDPQFSLAGIIFQSLKNIVAKAATSPFSLVSSIVSGGEELRYIEFPAGRAEIPDAAKEKLASIRELLYKRPELNLELTGYVDPETDRQALVDMALEQKIRAAAWADKAAAGGEKAGEMEKMQLTDKQYGKFLRQVYKKEVLSGPDAREDAKPLSDESLNAGEMKDAIRQGISVSDSRLQLLARERAKAVKSYILEDERVAGKRLFIREAASLAPREPGKFRASRVELNLS